MFGIRDNRQWIGLNDTMAFNQRNAMRFDTFEAAHEYSRVRGLQYFCIVSLAAQK